MGPTEHAQNFDHPRRSLKCPSTVPNALTDLPRKGGGITPQYLLKDGCSDEGYAQQEFGTAVEYAGITVPVGDKIVVMICKL